jgi:hypothetical protein
MKPLGGLIQELKTSRYLHRTQTSASPEADIFFTNNVKAFAAKETGTGTIYQRYVKDDKGRTNFPLARPRRFPESPIQTN